MRGFAAWLFGLAIEEPTEYPRLLNIRRKIYKTVGTLNAEIVRSPEPILFDQLDRSAFTSLRPGTVWGKTFDCAWIHVTGSMPKGHEGAAVMLGIRGEGLVYSPSGEVVDSISTVWQQADLPHSGAKYRRLDFVDTSNGMVDFYADVAYNGFLLYDYGTGVYHGARVAERDDVVFGLYYDYLTLVVLARATADAALASELWHTLHRAYRRFRAGNAQAARDLLAVPLAAASDSEFVYSAIGHAHL
ncbi:MAG TPA: hypothetical protein VIJ11_10375, partial [Galbitalea sp.]